MIVSCPRHRLPRVQINAEMLNYLSVYILFSINLDQFTLFYRVTKPSWFVCRCDLSVHVRPPPTSVDNQKAGHTQHTLGLLVFFIVIITSSPSSPSSVAFLYQCFISKSERIAALRIPRRSNCCQFLLMASILVWFPKPLAAFSGQMGTLSTAIPSHLQPRASKMRFFYSAARHPWEEIQLIIGILKTKFKPQAEEERQNCFSYIYLG